MRAQLIAGLAALFFVLVLTLWEFREVRRLEAVLGQNVGGRRAAAALKLRLLDERRGEYPAEWHRGVRRLHALSLLRVLASLVALALFWSLIF